MRGLLERFLLPLAVFAAALASFLAGATERTLWPPDELRYAEVSREMAAGGDLLVPHLDARPYPEKPPVFFWLGAAALRALGGGDLAPRLPSMVAGAGTVLLLFLLTRRLLGGAAALAAAAALATSFEFCFLARRANIDATLTFATTLSIAAFARGSLARGVEERPERWYALACAAAGLGALVKGPAGVLVPALACGGTVLLREGPARGRAPARALWRRDRARPRGGVGLAGRPFRARRRGRAG